MLSLAHFAKSAGSPIMSAIMETNAGSFYSHFRGGDSETVSETVSGAVVGQ